MGAVETLDWENGIWENDDAPKTQAEVLIASDWAPIRAFSDIIMNNPETVYGNLLPVMRQSDLRIANLECPLCGDASPVWKSGSVLKGDVKHARGLSAVPFDVVTLGNNHVFDHGAAAFGETLAVMDDQGIETVGAGMTPEDARKPLILDVNGVRIGIISFSEGEDLTSPKTGPGVFGWEIDEVVAIIHRIKASVDIIIVICHCGVEYIPFPPPYVAGTFQQLVDAGAHVVIGHHPHVPQGIQIYNQAPICYSLGNFVFYQETDLLYRKLGFLVKLGLAKGSVAYIKLVPYSIHDWGLSLLGDEERRCFLEKLKTVSKPLNNFKNIEKAWHGFLHYYGADGLGQELQIILQKLSSEPQKGAAMLRNRLTTMQHNQHWIDTLTRIMHGDLEGSPTWAYDLAEEWLTAKKQ
ncbi:MAG: CapA family protein [Deltaproteobacteria bacterium]|nr:CapA family protein [Deltaproteobacteria bacterium]